MSEKFVEEVATRLSKISTALSVPQRAISRAVAGAPLHDLSWYGWESRKLATVNMDHIALALRRLVNALETDPSDAEKLLEFVKTGRGFPWIEAAPKWREGKNPLVPRGRPRKHPTTMPVEIAVPTRIPQTVAPVEAMAPSQILDLVSMAGSIAVEAQRNKEQLSPKVLELIDRILSLLPKGKRTALMFLVAGALGTPSSVRAEVLERMGRAASEQIPSQRGCHFSGGTTGRRKKKHKKSA